MLSFLCSKASLVLLPSILMAYLIAATAGNFYQDIDITWGDQRAKIQSGGQLLTLSLDKSLGSGFQSKNAYLFGKIDMQLQLVHGNSAGTITTFYLSSQGPEHDEIDFEFLGNLSAQPYTIHTNVYTQGKGDKEQQFHLWFDPTTSFHTYSIVWHLQRIIFLVDNTLIRVFNNNEAIGIPFPNSQPMRAYSSLWNADDWATQGARVKTDWTKALFIASYRKFNAKGCVKSSGSSSCDSNSSSEGQTQELDSVGRNRLGWVQKNHMVYNYCTYFKRFPQGLPLECKQSKFL